MPKNFATFSYGTTLTDAIALTEVTTTVDPAAVTTRMRAVTQTGFQLRLQEEEAADGPHTAETVSWIAIESGRPPGLERS